MASVPSGAYQAAFANFVLEHILDVDRAAKEIHRVLISGGLFATTLANPAAPEFVIAEHTPLWFHRLIKGGEVHATHYAYRSVADLVKRFEEAGFQLTEALYYTHVRGYLQRFPVLNVMGSLYDRLVEAFGLYGIMGAACLVFKKS
jgi:SAM-dependent methyltransferase